jgi:YD repeat-containing protein
MLPLKWRHKGYRRNLFLALLLSSLASTAQAICLENDFTYDDQQPFFVCQTSCVASVPNSLSCTAPRQNRICNELCADLKTESCPSVTKNPINLSNGAKYSSATDYTSSGVYPLTIQRNYQSRYNAVDGPFGVNWTAGVAGTQIVSRNFGTLGDLYMVTRPNGTVIKYNFAGNGATTPVKSDTKERLQLVNNGYLGSTEWQLILPNGDIEVYDFDTNEFVTNGRYDSKIRFHVRNDGRFHSFQYDTGGRLISETDDNGRILTYEYNAGGRISTITTPAGQKYRYSYDANNNLTNVFYPDNTPADLSDDVFITYVYENTEFPNHLTGIIDETGNRHTNYVYDEAGRAIVSELAGGAERLEVLEYNGTSVRIRNALSKETVYRYLNVGSGAGLRRQLVAVDGEASANCEASNSSFTYDSNGFRDTMTNERGFITDYLHDEVGRELSRNEGLLDVNGSLVATPEARLVETDWNANGKRIEKREANIRTTITYTSPESRRIATLTESDLTGKATFASRTTRNTYTYFTADGRRVQTQTIDGPRTDITDDITTLNFSDLGNLIQYTNALNQQVQLANYNDRGQPQTITDENNVVTELSYSPRGWLESSTVVDPSGNGTNAITLYAYYNNGLLQRITFPDNTFLNYDYDAAQRLTTIENALGERITYTLDAEGNREQTEITGSNGNIQYRVAQAFDELSRLMGITSANNQVTENNYDVNDNLVETINPRLFSTRQVYDPLDRVAQIIDAKDGASHVTYDEQDRITSVTDAKGQVTRYTYDGYGHLLRRESPDTGTTDYSYDEAGNLLSMVDSRGIIALYTYDALNRLLSLTYPNRSEENVTYSYDDTTGGNFGIGRVTRITDQSGTTQLRYDYRGNIIEKRYSIGDQNYVTTYEYDLADKMTRQTYSTGQIINYAYDDLGRVSQITTELQGVTGAQVVVDNVNYLPYGPVTNYLYGNGKTYSVDYDQDYRINTILTDNLQLDFSYDANNNITQLGDRITTAENQDFEYDSLDRLINATGSYGVLDYLHDAIGNRTNQTRSLNANIISETYQYAPGSSRLQSIIIEQNGTSTSRQFSYDERGNIIVDDRVDNTDIIFAYNDANRIETATADTETVGYLYNNLGQRVSKTVGDRTEHYHYSLSGQLITVTLSPDQLVEGYIYLGTMPVGHLFDADNQVDSSTTNTPPSIAITEPDDNTTVTEGNEVSLAATASDVEDGNLDGLIQWVSSLDGDLGSGASVTTTLLSAGSHTITASVNDTQGASGTAQITLIVEVAANTPPTITIDLPANNTIITLGDTLLLVSSANDTEDGDLSPSVQWSSSLDGDLGTGADITVNTLSLGVHTITALVTDNANASSSTEITVTVLPVAVPNTPPVISISTPTNGTSIEQGTALPLGASATDNEDGDLSSFINWSSSLDGNLGTGAQLSITTLSIGTHVITAIGTDSSGLSGSATVSVSITAPPTNTPPVINLLSPSEGSRFEQGEAVTLNATAIDEQDSDLSNTITWTSSLDGHLGSGTPLTLTSLTAGQHTLTATVTDSDNNTVTATVMISITDAPLPSQSCAVECGIDLTAFEPSVHDCKDNWSFSCLRDYFKHRRVQHKALQCTTIATTDCKVRKSSPWLFVKGGSHTLEQLVQSGGDIDTALQWSSSIDGDLGNGRQLTTQLSPGKHRITLRVNDKMVAKSLINVKQQKQHGSAVVPRQHPNGIAIQPTDSGAYTFRWAAVSKEGVQ